MVRPCPGTKEGNRTDGHGERHTHKGCYAIHTNKLGAEWLDPASLQNVITRQKSQKLVTIVWVEVKN